MIEYRDNKTPVALITGASKGLGLTLARFLAAREYSLIINARGLEHLEDAKESLVVTHHNLPRSVNGTHHLYLFYYCEPFARFLDECCKFDKMLSDGREPVHRGRKDFSLR